MDSSSLDEAVRQFLELLDSFRHAWHLRHLDHATHLAEKLITLLPSWGQWMRTIGGDTSKFLSGSDMGNCCILLGCTGKHATLRAARCDAEKYLELQPFLPSIERGEAHLHLGPIITAAVAASPGLRQSDVAKALPDTSRAMIREACYYLEALGRIRRVKEGRTYTLHPASEDHVGAPTNRKMETVA